MDCEPVLDYGRHPVSWRYLGAGYHHAEASNDDVELRLTLTTDLRVGFEGGQASSRTLLKEGDTRFVALSWGGATPPETYEQARAKQVWTAHHWQHWLGRGRFPDHPWRSYLQRSALTLKGLTYAPTGAVVAAGSTSFPETPGGDRNYDYRFSWIRDSTFALWAMYSLGFDWEAVDFFSFIADIAERDPDLQIMYGIGAEDDLREEELEHLPGYLGSRPVRTGNAAYAQRQHDVWGALLDSVYLHSRAADHLDNRIWPILDVQVRQALEHWREPDAGIWEVRGELRHFTSSKIMCWVALDRGARLARMTGEDDKAAEWERAAEEIREDVLEHGVDERGVLVQSYGSTALDASLLLAPLVRFLPADDPRIRATVLAIRDELSVDGLVLRYRVEETDDGFSGEEGTFTICSFWMVSALCEIGEFEQGPGAVRQAAVPGRAAGAVRARRSTRTAASTWATSPRRSPTWPSSTPCCTSSGSRRSVPPGSRTVERNGAKADVPPEAGGPVQWSSRASKSPRSGSSPRTRPRARSACPGTYPLPTSIRTSAASPSAPRAAAAKLVAIEK